MPLPRFKKKEVKRPLFLLETEEVRFELTKRFTVYTLSKRAPSATRTLLQDKVYKDKEASFNSQDKVCLQISVHVVKLFLV